MNNDIEVVAEKAKTETNESENQTIAALKLSGLQTSNEVIIWLPAEELKSSIKPDPSNRIDHNNHNHILRLRKSIRRDGYCKEKPIIVGSDLIIRAGEHRYYACIEENSGAWIKISDSSDLETLSRIDDIAKPWSTISWIRKHANGGRGDYPKIIEFIEKYGFGIKVSMMILADQSNECPSDDFDRIKGGEFEVKDWDKAYWKADRIKDFGQFFLKPKDCDNTHFAAAVLKCLKTQGYNHDLMLEKVKVQSRKLRLQRNRRDNLEILQDIYNYRRRGQKLILTNNL